MLAGKLSHFCANVIRHGDEPACRRRIGGRSKLRRMVEAPSRLLLELLERHDGVARDDRQQLVFGRRNRHVERHAKKIEFETQSLRQRPEHYPFVAHFRAFRHRSEEHTSELQSLMRISYAVFCLKKKKKQKETQ